MRLGFTRGRAIKSRKPSSKFLVQGFAELQTGAANDLLENCSQGAQRALEPFPQPKLGEDTERIRRFRVMTTIRRFCCDDLLRIAPVNLDHLTETYNMAFYQTYLATWPDYFHIAKGPNGSVMGYIMGKVEGKQESWHGHVTALSVAPEYRRQNLAKKLMGILEEVTEKTYNAYFVDLFVRASNAPAIRMYEKLGYIVYRRVLRYYSGEEDGLDMRKAMPRDKKKKSVIPLKKPVTPDELEFD